MVTMGITLLILLSVAVAAIVAASVLFYRRRIRRLEAARAPDVVAHSADEEPYEPPPTEASTTTEAAIPIPSEESGTQVRPPPIRRGGRPRDATRALEQVERQEPETKPHRPRPEIVCWKEGWNWILAAEVPEDLLEDPGLSVLQDEAPLTPDESYEGRYRLKRLLGKVNVRSSKDEVPIEIDLVEEKYYLLFRLVGHHERRGRRARQATSGSYLVVVPDGWERDEEVSGPPPVNPEPVSIDGYWAHFFYLSRDDARKIAFVTPGGEKIEIETGAARFELVGTLLNDSSEDVGPLFGGGPPRIRALHEQGWRNVGTVVVGEEGGGKKRWRTQFSPDRDRVEQHLPDEVAKRGGGWYFVRIYDTNDDLVESLDFRFMSTLEEIRVSDHPFLPVTKGHTVVDVEFLHESGCEVRLTEGLADGLQIAHEDQKTSVTIPPNPAWDETHWIVGARGGPQVEVTVLVERVWWAAGEENTVPSEWTDKPLTLSRGCFAATSKKALWLRFPRPRWVDKVDVGFDRLKSRPYRVEVGKRELAIPLRDFGDSVEIGDRQQEYQFKVWDDAKDPGCIEAAIAVIPADRPAILEPFVPVTQGEGAQLDEKPPADLSRIAPPRLATALTRLRSSTSGPLRQLIAEVYAKRRRGRKARFADNTDFIREALCVIALSWELLGAGGYPIPGLRKRWIERAFHARDALPDIMEKVRARYEDLTHGKVRRAS